MTGVPSNRAIAAHLTQIADAVDLIEPNPARARSYRNAARRIESSADDIAAVALADGLAGMPGIGSSLAKTIGEFVSGGQSQRFAELDRAIPDPIWRLLEIRGLGARTIGRIWRELGVFDPDGLRQAGVDGRLAAMSGIGPRKVAQVLVELDRIAADQGLIGLGLARALATAAAEEIAKRGDVIEVLQAGPARRGLEAVDGIDLLVVSHAPDSSELTALTKQQSIEFEKSARQDPVRLRIKTTSPEQLGTSWLLSTGSDRHLRRIDQIARRRGMQIGLETAQFDSEAELYRALGLQFIPPELREDSGEIELAQAGRLPKLIGSGDLASDLHCHSNWSDGQAPIFEMGKAAAGLGLSHLAITDHSQSLAVANGLSAERLARQAAEIAAADSQVSELTLLQGTESEIRIDGSLDFAPEVLARLDWVNASVHVGLGQSRATMTERLLAAIDNPALCSIGHPTGRIILGRKGFEFDFDMVFSAAAEAGVALEINSQPSRLDLSSELARRAAAAGATLSLNSDAHAPDQLATTGLGLVIARRAGLSAEQVVNCRTWAEIAEARARRLARH